MTVLKRVLQQLTPLNLILLVLLLYTAGKAYPYIVSGVSVTPPVPHTKAENPALPDEKPLPPLKGVDLVVSSNPFHPDRIIPPLKKKKPVVVRKRKRKKPEFVLLGTMMDESKSVAFVQDLRKTGQPVSKGGGVQTLSVGDRLSGYRLDRIDVDSIVMVRGRSKITVRLHDKKKGSGKKPVTPRRYIPYQRR